MQSQKQQMISVRFQGKPFNITVIQVYAPTSNAEEAEVEWFYILGLQNHCSHEGKRCLLLGRKIMTNLDSILKSRHYFANKGLSSQSYGFSSSPIWM